MGGGEDPIGEGVNPVVEEEKTQYGRGGRPNRGRKELDTVWEGEKTQ